MREARRDAQLVFGASLVPRRASVNIETFSFGFLFSASSIVAINSSSAFPTYSVDKYTRVFAFSILVYTDLLGAIDHLRACL